MDICARVDMNVGISFVRLSIVNANECVRIVSGQHMARNTRATQTPGRERFFLQGARDRGRPDSGRRQRQRPEREQSESEGDQGCEEIKIVMRWT